MFTQADLFPGRLLYFVGIHICPLQRNAYDNIWFPYKIANAFNLFCKKICYISWITRSPFTIRTNLLRAFLQMEMFFESMLNFIPLIRVVQLTVP